LQYRSAPEIEGGAHAGQKRWQLVRGDRERLHVRQKLKAVDLAFGHQNRQLEVLVGTTLVVSVEPLALRGGRFRVGWGFEPHAAAGTDEELVRWLTGLDALHDTSPVQHRQGGTAFPLHQQAGPFEQPRFGRHRGAEVVGDLEWSAGSGFFVGGDALAPLGAKRPHGDGHLRNQIEVVAGQA
jgi:hypothetical protein